MENQSLNHNLLEEEIEKNCQQIWHLAEESEGNSLDLVLILRKVEEMHREIREKMLEPSLPDTRHRLYILLKNLEETGGWPYIPRMRLKDLCQHLLPKAEKSTTTD